MAVKLRYLVAVLALLAMATCLAQSLKVTVEPERGAGNKLTGRYVAHVNVVGAPAARLVVFRINIPDAYVMNTSPQANQTWLVDVKPGTSIFRLPADADPAQSKVFFAEYASDAAQMHGLWCVALLTSDNEDPKHVCDLVFTAKGRPTSALITFATVSVKDGNLTLLIDQGTYGSPRVPLFGDLNWNGQIDGADLGLFAAAWSAYYSAHPETLDFADLFPLDNDSQNLNQRTSAGDGEITGADYGMFAFAWAKYFGTTSQAANAKQGSSRRGQGK